MATFFICANVIVQITYNFNILLFHESGFDTVWERMSDFNFSKLPLFFGVATYAFEGIGILFGVRSSMGRPAKFSKIFKIQMIILGLLYTILPATSELAFGKAVPSIILFSLPINNSFYLVIQILYVISALLGYPVQLFPAFNIFERSSMIKKFLFDQEGNCKNSTLRCILRVFLIGFMLFIALIAKNFNLFLNLLGSGVFTYLGYLLPIIVYHAHFKSNVPKINFLVNITAFTIGFVLGGLGMFVSIREFMNSENDVYLL